MHQFNASGRCVLCGMGQAAIRVTGEQYHCGRADPGVQRLNSEPLAESLRDHPGLQTAYSQLRRRFPGSTYAAVFLAEAQADQANVAVVILDVCHACKPEDPGAVRYRGRIERYMTGSFVISRSELGECQNHNAELLRELVSTVVHHNMTPAYLGGADHPPPRVPINKLSLYRLREPLTVQPLNSEPDPPLSSVPMRYVVVYVPADRENEIRAIAARMVQAAKDYPTSSLETVKLDMARNADWYGDPIQSSHDEVIEQAERYVADARRALLAECAQEAVDNMTDRPHVVGE